MCKILIVEDNAVFRQSLRETLVDKFPFLIIEEATGGKEALQKIDVLPPDLIFMDIKLPGENGLKLTKKIKNTYPKIIIIILTSYNLPEYRDAAHQCGATYFLTKSSSTRNQIVKLVESILSDINGNRDCSKKIEMKGFLIV